MTHRTRCPLGLALLPWLAVFACGGGERSPAPAAPAASPSAAAGPRTDLPRGLEILDESPAGVAPSASAAPVAAEDVPTPPWAGPWLTVTRASTTVYATAHFDEKLRLGYVRSGGRVPVEEKPVARGKCSAGWYKVARGPGYICGNAGTLDPKSPELRFTVRTPDLSAVLPYTYVRNSKHGTPLYKSIPSADQMLAYEPYLADKAAKADAPASTDGASTRPAGATTPAASSSPAASATASAAASAEAPPRLAASATPPPAASATAEGRASEPPAPTSGDSTKASEDSVATREAASALGLGGPAEAVEAEPWWQTEDAKVHELRIEDLSADADGILEKRMVSGFYVAVDKTFRWNGRTWYKTTRGLVAPADRFHAVAGSDFHGVELDGSTFKLPIGWVHGGRKSLQSYKYDEGKKQLAPAKLLKQFEAVQLTGEEREFQDVLYAELADGSWARADSLRITRPGPAPADVGAEERWIDVNEAAQTLVAYVGTRPVYATLVSTGKTHKQKAKDHRTPLGEFRIREKHVSATMDGDGSAAGDLPYSIEDVPFVMYYHRSYALHAAFWHRNFGNRMSHGCVNLAPLDAKHLFLFADPQLPEGWHGVVSTDDSPGSRVIVHE